MIKKQSNEQLMNEYHSVIDVTDNWLHSLNQFNNYHLKAIINGILYSVFKMVYTISRNDKNARKIIEIALNHYENEQNKNLKIKA